MNKRELEELLSVEVDTIVPIGGGCIGSSARVSTIHNDTYFVKRYSKQGMIEPEVMGLKTLKTTNAIHVPSVIAYNANTLILEYIESVKTKASFFEDFGRQLAALHKNEVSNYGFEVNTYLGTYLQNNAWSSTWNGFFVNNRLVPQFDLAVQSGYLKCKKIEKFLYFVESLLQGVDPKPSLLHGDLWSGNFMVGSKGEPVLFDPAVSYGHWEFELAMTKLFGGFPPQFYSAYYEINEVTDGYKLREDVYTLYHLLNHLNLFGTSYLSQVSHIIDKYI